MNIKSDIRIDNMKTDKYKDLIFAFCDLLKKRYNIESYLRIEDFHLCGKHEVALVLQLVAPFKARNCYCKNYVRFLVDFDVALIESRPTYRKLFNRLFDKKFSCHFWLDDFLYATQTYNNFNALKIAIDLEDFSLHIENSLPNASTKLKDVA